jgi:hypothetical protein
VLEDGLDAGREGSLLALEVVSKVGATGGASKAGAELDWLPVELEDPRGLEVLFGVRLIGAMAQMNFKLS